MMRISLMLGLLLLPMLAHGATNIQYVTATGIINAASAGALESPTGTAVVTIPEDLGDIIWPVPSGCAAGQDRWSRVTDPEAIQADGTGLAVRTDLFWFTTTSLLLTGCHVVSSAAELWALVDTTLAASYTSNTLIPFLSTLNVAVLSVCPASDMSSECDDVHTAMVTLNDVPVGAQAALKAFLDQAVILKADAENFQTLQGW